MLLDYYLEMLQTIDENTTVLTPNRRLAATLHKLYADAQIAQQKTAWVTPDILPITTWIERLWQEYGLTSFSDDILQVLNPLQEQFLWEAILNQSKSSHGLLQIAETAELAKSAFGLLQQWNVDIHDPQFSSAEDYQALQQWIIAFQQLCARNRWVDTVSLIDLIAAKIKSNEIKPNVNIILIGFNELSPQLTELFTACASTEEVSPTDAEKPGSRGQAAGRRVNGEEDEQHNSQSKRIALTDTETEILTMAQFAKSIIEKDPSATIGCVIPTLDKIRDRVQQIFSEVFASDNTYLADPKNQLFNISAGKSMASYPVIHTLLLLLGLNKKALPAEIFSYLLASPFLGESETERLKRAKFDNRLHQQNIHQMKMTDVIANEHCPLLATRLESFLIALQELPEKQSYQDWANTFTALLTHLGWPGERSLSSEEYQVVQHFLSLLHDFASLDHVSTTVTYEFALKTLQQLLNNSVFQPESPIAPIQVLGVLEAAGLPFQYLWLSGMDDMSWPPQPKPNPFIPKRLQRELQMPHATAERELQYCEQLTQQFMRSATNVMVSHAVTDEALELHPSPLIRHLPEIPLTTLALPNYFSPLQKIYATKSLEYRVDDIGPPIRVDEKIRGGVNVIKQQALCPFRAFAESRLHAYPIENLLPGLRAKDRGTMIHQALELIWRQLQDQATLLLKSEAELTLIIKASVDEVVNNAMKYGNDQQYILLEKKRLQQLLADWLAIEKMREPFSVMSHEKSAEIKLNQLTLSLRIDRIDALENGKKLIIDYKTGKNNHISAWFSDRPEEPQLPLYSLLDPANTFGITFAQVATGEHCFKGISQYAIATDGIKMVTETKLSQALSWQEQIQKWQIVLEKLSDDFSLGIAKVDPKDAKETCEWCQLKPLCRINEELVVI